MLKPISTQLLHREVQRQLKAFILENRLAPGDRLPAETEVARQLGVSRNVVREAFKALEAVGLVEVRPGSGFHVARFDAARFLDNYTYSLIVDGIGVDELWYVRRALEFTFIGQVAERIGPEDLRELDEIIAQMERDLAAGVSTVLTSLRIHRVAYRCLNNRVLACLLDACAEVISRVWKATREPYPSDVLKTNVDIHRRLVQALHNRDAAAARSALEEDFGANQPVWANRP